MTTSPLIPASSSAPNQVGNANASLKPEDFINMMVTQLQNQDPLQPTSNQELLTQMSQIGQLQSTTDLQNSLKTLVLQSNISAASNMIGKAVEGQDDHGAPINGTVNSVHVVSGQVSLDLDNGKTLSISSVTSVKPLATTTGS